MLMNNIGLAEPGLWASRIDGGTVRLVTFIKIGTRTDKDPSLQGKMF